MAANVGNIIKPDVNGGVPGSDTYTPPAVAWYRSFGPSVKNFSP